MGWWGAIAEHRLAIMRDSRIGTFGAVGLILFLMLEIVTARRAAARPALARVDRCADPRACAASRARALFSLRPAHRPGRHVLAGVGPLAAPVALIVAILVAVLALRVAGVAALAAGLVVAFAVAWFQNRRLGGLTGDVLGATVELAELAALLTVLAWLNLRP